MSAGRNEQSPSAKLRQIAEHPMGVMNTLEQRRAFLVWAADAADALAKHRCRRKRGYHLPVKIGGATVVEEGEPQPIPVHACPECSLLARLSVLTGETEQG